MIFDAFERFDDSPKLSRESDYAFLNRSARPEMENARQLLEELLLDYPEPDDLVSRFKSGSNSNFRSAEFELLLFSYLHRLGFTLSAHPTIEGNSARPDFLVTPPSGDQFYLEAVMAHEDGEDQTRSPLIATTLDVFSTESHPNFSVVVHTSGCPSTQPSRRKLIRSTIRWLDSLDPDEVQANVDLRGHDSLPTLTWAHENFEVSIQALPLRPERRGKAGRLLAVQFGQAGWIDAWSPIKEAIRFKGSKYGSLDLPLIVAVNFIGHHLDRMDEMQALFGQELIVLSTTDPDAPPRMDREPNGAWIGKGGPQFRRVSGAWLFDGMCVYNLSSRRPTLYLHPWARLPAPADLLRFPHAVVVEGNMQWRDEGIFPGKALGLSDDWPSAR